MPKGARHIPLGKAVTPHPEQVAHGVRGRFRSAGADTALSYAWVVCVYCADQFLALFMLHAWVVSFLFLEPP